MKFDCFAFGIGGIVIGTIALLSSLTQFGRDLDRAYLKTLSKRWRGPETASLRNASAIVVGAVFLLVGLSISAYATYCWAVGMPCG